MDEKDELVEEFLVESFEYLDALDEDLLTLENEAATPDLLARIFRALHTIKGTGGFLDFDNLVGIAHAGESLLDCLRKGTVEVNDEISSVLFDLVDAIRDVLKSIEETGRDGQEKYEELVASLTSLQSGAPKPLPSKDAIAEGVMEVVEAPVEDHAPASEPAAAENVAEESAAESTEKSAGEPAGGEAGAEDDEEDGGFAGYLARTRNLVDEIRKNVAGITADSADSTSIENIFKACKEIVGSSSIMGYRKLISVVIPIRKKLDAVKKGEEDSSQALHDLLLAHVAAANELLGIIEETEEEGSEKADALIEKHAAALKEQGGDAPADQAAPAESEDKEASEAKAPAADTEPAQATQAEAKPDKPSAENPAEQATPEKPAAEATAKQVPAAAPAPESAANAEAPAQKAAPVQKAASTPTGKTEENNAGTAAKGKGSESSKRSLADNNIRVNVDLLDALMNLVGELVLTRNQILQFTSTGANPAFANSAQNLDLITTELQEGVMKTRMQTIGTIWKKFPRVVRDLAKLCNKQANVEMEGEDTELDKTIIEAIKDPLTHLIRNSVDHGFESPEERVKLGKPAEGRLSLRAFHEGGHVNIEISDDGRGIDPEKIKTKALNNGVISQSDAVRMSDREILNLIFVSGLSTAEQVSNISGRGVGMDVVKTYIERIGGTVDINSRLGAGTTIKIKIPLTLAIIPALIVKVSEERFALPQVNLLELVRLEGEQIQTGIEMIHDTPVHRLRGKLLPLVYLDDVLGLKDSLSNEQDREKLAVINIVVLQAEDQPFGLVVHEVVDTEEVVVKPLSKLLKHVSTYAGATIMGDGKIALILDVAGLARKGHVMSQEDHQRSKSESVGLRENTTLTTLLLARLNAERQIAIPLSMISRLEEIDPKSIEKTGNREIVQYRGYLMPLVRLSEILNLPHSADSEKETLQVVVCAKNGVNIGMVVDEIVDIVEEHVEIQERPGVIKSVAIIQSKATELLSIQEILETIDTGIFESEEIELQTSSVA